MKIYDVAPIQIFRYKITEFYEDEQESVERSGYVAGFCFADAVARLEKINTPPSKEFSDCNLSSIDELYEVDSFDAGVIFDDDIKETFEAEAKQKEA